MDDVPQDPTVMPEDGASRSDAAASLSWMAVPDPAAYAAPTVPTAPAPKRRAGLVIATAAVAMVAAAGIVVGATAGSHTSSPRAPSGSSNTAVLTALDSTLGAKTADLHLSMAMSVPGAGLITAAVGV